MAVHPFQAARQGGRWSLWKWKTGDVLAMALPDYDPNTFCRRNKRKILGLFEIEI
jgi:cell division protein FtsI/penicillin-binding protein 2